MNDETCDPTQPCDSWHTHGPARDILDAFGHRTDAQQDFFEFMEHVLPVVSPDPNIHVGSTGYWDLRGPLTAPQFGQTRDSVGRRIFFVGEDVLCQRYHDGFSLIRYPRAAWRHSNMGNDERVMFRRRLLQFRIEAAKK